MSGVRLGERALQIGDDDLRCIALIAAKSGLTGTAAVVVRDDAAAARVQRVIADTGALADVQVMPGGALPFADGAFDAIVVHNPSHTVTSTDAVARAQWLGECLRVLRGGGRMVVIEAGAAGGLRALLAGGKRSRDTGESEGTLAALRAGGFAAVRVLGDRDGLRFVEGLKSN